MAPEIVNTIGLLLDVFGVIIVFKYGWPQPVPYEIGYDDSPEDQKEKRQAEWHTRYSLAGLGLIVGGFLIQIIAVWI